MVSPSRPSYPQNPQNSTSASPHISQNSTGAALIFSAFFPEVCTPSKEEARSTIWTPSLCCAFFVSVLWIKLASLSQSKPHRRKKCHRCKWDSCHKPAPATTHEKKLNKTTSITVACGVWPYCSVPMKRLLVMYTYSMTLIKL